MAQRARPKLRTKHGYPKPAANFGLRTDAVVAIPARGEQLFRLVDKANTRKRYHSRVAREKPEYQGGQPAILSAGISMFDAVELVLSRARRFPIVVARVDLVEGLDFYVAKTLGQGHYTVWGDPESLRKQSEIVLTKEEK